MAAKYELDGYAFLDAADLERAKKEKETIAYISAKTDITDMKALYKIYKSAVEKKSFQTVFGLEYIKDIRDRLVGSGAVTEDILEPIPVGKVIIKTAAGNTNSKEEKQPKKQQEDMEKLRFQNIVKNFLIAVLVVVIGVMLFVTYNYKYSIFTYFTNYEEKIRNEIADEYKEWESQLEEREKALEEKENQ